MACAMQYSEKDMLEVATPLRDMLCALGYPDVSCSDDELLKLFFCGGYVPRYELLEWTYVLIDPSIADELRSSPDDDALHRSLVGFLNWRCYLDDQTNSSFVSGTATIQEQGSVWRHLFGAATYCLRKRSSLQLPGSSSGGLPHDTLDFTFEQQAVSVFDPEFVSTPQHAISWEEWQLTQPHAKSAETFNKSPPIPAVPSLKVSQQNLDEPCDDNVLQTFFEAIEPLTFPLSATVKELCEKINDMCVSLRDLYVKLKDAALKMPTVQAKLERSSTDDLIHEAKLKNREVKYVVTSLQHAAKIFEKLSQPQAGAAMQIHQPDCLEK